MEEKKLHIVMFPWFAMGHITPFLHLANHLATRGHQTTLLLPNKAKLLLESSNHHPSLITLRPIPVCHVSPLPHGAETTADIPTHLEPHLATAMDLTRRHVESAVADVIPIDLLFYDFTPWAHDVAVQFGAKSVCYVTSCAACIAIGLVPGFGPNGPAQIPDGYPSKKVVFRGEEIKKAFGFLGLGYGSGLTFYERGTDSLSACDAICIRTLREVEGVFCDYIIKSYNKPVLLTGPILSPGSDRNEPDPKWAKWLDQFDPGSVVFCTLGSQVILEKAKFQELVLGFEMSKLPFLAVLKPPSGCASVDEALPQAFKERVGQKGVVYDGWVPQPEILSHKSIGCFVTHCGFGAMWESLLSECQIVAMPQLGDQILNARLMAEEMKVCVEVERDCSNNNNINNGWITKESLCNAIKSVMDECSEIGDLVRKNHAKWRHTLVTPGFMSSYIDNFINDLKTLLG